MKRALFSIVAALGIGLAQSAAAETGREMVVVLDDGSHVRGRIEEIVPGERCVVRAKGGARRVVAWTSIKRIVPPGTPDPPEPPPADAPPAPATTPPADAPPAPTVAAAPAPAPHAPARTVLVHVKAPRAMRVEKSVAAGPWEAACTTPCDVELPVDAAYRIVDDGQQVRGFRLDAGAGSALTIDVSPGSAALGALGVAGMIAGTILLYVGAAAGSDEAHDGTGAGLVLGGLAIGVAGAIAFATSGSSIDQTPTTRDSLARAARATESRATRRAADLSPPKRDLAPPPRGLSAPLFTFRF